MAFRQAFTVLTKITSLSLPSSDPCIALLQPRLRCQSVTGPTHQLHSLTLSQALMTPEAVQLPAQFLRKPERVFNEFSYRSSLPS